MIYFNQFYLNLLLNYLLFKYIIGLLYCYNILLSIYNSTNDGLDYLILDSVNTLCVYI